MALDELAGLIEHAAAEDGQPPFSDQSLVELSRGERDLVGIDGVAAAVVGNEEFELVVSPHVRGQGHGTRLLTEVLARTPVPRFAWAHGDHPASRVLASRFGFEAVRTLLQLRAEVPAGDSLREPQGAEAGTLREPQGTAAIAAFRPGPDDAEWLQLNAAAFADHPEQGRLAQADLEARMAEDWFEPADFLVLRDGERMIGFCWLKVEDADSGDAVGEFYVVGIDPSRQGEGLGRVLVSAGLARLAERGIRTAALYVEADNAPALRLYRSFGFTDHTIDIRYERRSS